MKTANLQPTLFPPLAFRLPLLLAILATVALPLRADPTLYVSDLGINDVRIQRFDAKGMASPVLSSISLGSPSSMAVDGRGNLYVATGCVHKYSATGKDLGVFATNDVETLVFDKAGFLYGSDYRGSIFQFSAAGVARLFAIDTNGSPIAMAMDALGNLYAANHRTTSVQKFAPDGTDLGIFINTGASAHPTALAIDSANRVFVAAGDAQQVFKYKPDGSLHSSFARGTMVTFPAAMVIDSADNVYIKGQDLHHAIICYSPNGIGHTVVGSGVGSGAALAVTDVPLRAWTTTLLLPTGLLMLTILSSMFVRRRRPQKTLLSAYHLQEPVQERNRLADHATGRPSQAPAAIFAPR